MFECKAALFLYAISPVHMGAGTAYGFIDNPIQRERHTNHPCFAGSGIKGAVRHSFESLGGDQKLIDSIFGPEAQGSNLHAGAVSFGDAQLVAFPVRCTRESFVYATCPQALARTKRLLKDLIGSGCVDWEIPSVATGECIVLDDRLLAHSNQRLQLEAFEYSAIVKPKLKSALSERIMKMAIPEGDHFQYFQEKFKKHLVILSDSDFTFFVEHATVVETHVRIDDQTGAAKSGGLFNTENLPPESILIAPLLTSRTFDGSQKSANETYLLIKPALNHKLLQIGGNATTGRGLVMVRVIGD